MFSNVHDKLETNRKKNRKTTEVHPRYIVMSVLGLVIGLTLALPPFISAHSYYNSFKTGKISEIKRAVYLMPYDRRSFLQASDIFMQNNFMKDSLEVANIGVEHFPDSFWLWSRVAELSPKNGALHLEAVKKLHLLDPNNPAYALP
jgi:hypothetical protein